MSGGLLTGDGVWGTPGNWSSAAIPVTNDTASIPKSMGNNITDAGGDAKAIDLDALHTHPGFVGKFGDTSVPIQTAADLVHAMGPGGFYFECHKSGSNFVTDEVRIECALASSIVQIGSDVASAGDITRIHALRGNVTLTGNIMFTDSGGIVVVGSIRGPDDVSLKIVAAADTLPDFIQTSGKTFVDNVVTRMLIAGGVCVKDVNKAVTIDVFAGGTLIYNHDAVGGEVVLCRVHSGGTLDLNQNGVLKVFDATIRFRGGVIHKNDVLHTINLVDLEEEG